MAELGDFIVPVAEEEWLIKCDARRIYRRWEADHYSVYDLDLTADRDQWLQIGDDERWQWFCLGGFYHFRATELLIARVLARYLSAMTDVWQQIALTGQIADEGRHAAFFERYFQEVMAESLPARAKNGDLAPSPAYRRVFLDGQEERSLAVMACPDRRRLAEAFLLSHIVMEGSVAMASFTVARRTLQAAQRFPCLEAALTLLQRDEVRHAQLGLTVLGDLIGAEPSLRERLSDDLTRLLPDLSQVLEVHPERARAYRSLGLDPADRRERSFRLLRRNICMLGLTVDLQPYVARLAA